MGSLISAVANAVCNVQWGYVTIIVVYLAFLCYWMLIKQHKEIDLVMGVGTGVFFLIGFIMAFFAKCAVCWILIGVQLLILDILAGYFVFRNKNGRKTEVIAFTALGAVFFCAFLLAVVLLAPISMLFVAIDLFIIDLVLCYFIFTTLYKKPVCACAEKNEAVKAEEETVAPVEDETPAVEEVVATEEVKEAEEVEEAEPAQVSLKENLSIMKTLVRQSRVTKLSICKFLSETYGDKVILNNRPNRTKNDRLPMADTHYVVVEGKNVCFVYVYQDDKGGVLLLVKTTRSHYKMIAAKHDGVCRSAFPRRGEWYSIIVDDTYSEEEIYRILSDAIAIAGNEKYIPEDWTFEKKASVEASEVNDLISDVAATSMVESGTRTVNKKKKGSINVDTLNQYFAEGETVTLEEIKNRIPNVDKNMTYCKVLARGTLSKALIVDLDDYSNEAIKMILITGGRVIRPQR